MKVLLINGSIHQDGCTYTALTLVQKSLQEEGVEADIFQIGKKPIQDCFACGVCRTSGFGKCVIADDCVNELIETAKEYDGFVFGSPVYYAHPCGRLVSLMDRTFFAGGASFKYKPAAAIVSARRAGTTASLDTILKHFTINNMPVVSSNYWNMVHGSCPEDVLKDEEGCQIMRVLGKNMAWLLKCIEAGKKNGIDIPQQEQKIKTNFIR